MSACVYLLHIHYLFSEGLGNRPGHATVTLLFLQCRLILHKERDNGKKRMQHMSQCKGACIWEASAFVVNLVGV